MQISIIDYGMGNLLSVQSAINYLGFKSKITSSYFDIIKSDKIILPGVGSFKKAMKVIKQKKIDKAIFESINKECQLLGICLGMQLLGTSSTEDGLTNGLGLIDNKVTKFKKKNNEIIKVPHVGFNSIAIKSNSKLCKNIKDNNFYFVHSYKFLFNPKKDKFCTGSFTYGGNKCVAIYEKKNIFGTQFHPEKSQTNGLVLIKNFLEL